MARRRQPSAEDFLLETGVFLAGTKLQPYVQYAAQDFDDSTLVDEERISAGLALFLNGHSNNLKLSFTRIEPDGGDSRDQINLQWQIFQF